MSYGILDNGVVIAQFVVPMKMTSNVPEWVTDTLSLKRYTGRRAAQRWEIETRLEPLNVGAEALMVNLVVNGHTGTLSAIVPQNVGVVKRRTATSNALATGAVGVDTLAVTGNNGLLPLGTFIRFANHSKIYMLRSDLQGNGTMRIFPALQVAQNGTAFSYRDDVIMPVSYDTDTIIGMSFEDGILMDNGTIKLIERL